MPTWHEAYSKSSIRRTIFTLFFFFRFCNDLCEPLIRHFGVRLMQPTSIHLQFHYKQLSKGWLISLYCTRCDYPCKMMSWWGWIAPECSCTSSTFVYSITYIFHHPQFATSNRCTLRSTLWCLWLKRMKKKSLQYIVRKYRAAILLTIHPLLTYTLGCSANSKVTCELLMC